MAACTLSTRARNAAGRPLPKSATAEAKSASMNAQSNSEPS